MEVKFQFVNKLCKIVGAKGSIDLEPSRCELRIVRRLKQGRKEKEATSKNGRQQLRQLEKIMNQTFEQTQNEKEGRHLPACQE